MGAVLARYQIKQVAARRGFTLARLADELEMSEPRLRAIANNRVRNVTVGTLEKIAAHLGEPLSEMFEPTSLSEVPTLVASKKEDAAGN